MLESPKTIPRFDDLLGEYMQNIYAEYIWTHGYDLLQQKKAKQNKKKEVTKDKVLGKSGTKLQSPLSVKPHGMHLTPPAQLWQHPWNVVNQETILKTEHPGFLLKAGHIGILCLAHTPNSRLPEETQVFSIICCLYK